MSTEPSDTPASPDAVVDLRGVRKHYGTVHAVDGVDLRIRRGELFGLIGHNGAGKSTLFKLMLGLIEPTAGTLRVAGADVRGPDFRAARARIGYLPENVVLWDNLSGEETLRFFARLKGVGADACRPLLERVGLGAAAARPVREYSKGMRQRLGFAQALLGQPQVLFLDEPTTGLDPQAIHHFHTTLQDLRAQGVTIVLSSHILSELQERADRIALLANGQVRALGSIRELREARPLPLRIVLQVTPPNRASVAAALQAVHDVTVNPTEDGLVLTCPRPRKMAALQAVSALEAQVADVTVVEPSLEALFFGIESHAIPVEAEA